MAVQKNLIQVNRNKIFAHLYGGAAGDSSTILLTDLVSPDETTAGTLTVNIATCYVNLNDNGSSGINVRRGTSSGTIILDMHGTSEFPGNCHIPALAFNNTSSVFVTWNIPGLVILELHKVAGYVDPLYNKGV